MRSVDWQARSVCTAEDARAFAADKKPLDSEIHRLGLICSSCPVTKECAALALEIGAPGVYAGVYFPACGAGRPEAKRALIRKANQ
jgi:hypothetical protein